MSNHKLMHLLRKDEESNRKTTIEIVLFFDYSRLTVYIITQRYMSLKISEESSATSEMSAQRMKNGKW